MKCSLTSDVVKKGKNYPSKYKEKERDSRYSFKFIHKEFEGSLQDESHESMSRSSKNINKIRVP